VLGQGRGSAVETAGGSADGGQQRPGVGKQTLTEQLPAAGATQPAVSIGAPPSEVAKKTPSITGVVVAGVPLSDADVDAIDKAAASVPKQFRHYVAYADSIKVGGSLAWRANNPGNLRDASTKIGKVPGASGTFAVFATMEDGRAAQRDLYLNTYGAMKVRVSAEPVKTIRTAPDPGSCRHRHSVNYTMLQAGHRARLLTSCPDPHRSHATYGLRQSPILHPWAAMRRSRPQARAQERSL